MSRERELSCQKREQTPYTLEREREHRHRRAKKKRQYNLKRHVLREEEKKKINNNLSPPHTCTSSIAVMFLPRFLEVLRSQVLGK